MKFITFGCWNRGECNMENINNPVSVVMQHIKNDVIKSQRTSTPYNFIVVAGDNYYPENVNKVKFFNETNLNSGFTCLEQIPIQKYIIFGNHDYSDKYNKNETIKSDIITNEPMYCLNITRQLEYSRKPNFTFFNEVMYQYDK